MTEPLTIDIGICTYKRPHLTLTLDSLAEMHVEPHWQIRIIIADNDAEPSARETINTYRQHFPYELEYVHAPQGNISIARNACLDHAHGRIFLFVDDDELVRENWLNEIVARQIETGADVVLGPVQSIYEPDAPLWIQHGAFHESRPVWVDGRIITGYSCNTLIMRNHSSTRNQRFRLDLGKSGGEDTAFFSGIYETGGIIEYAPEAIVTEDVPPARARLGWLLKRRFRFGQTHGELLIESKAHNIPARLKAVFIACAKAGICWTAMIPHIFNRSRFYFWLLRGVLHAGVVARLCGATTLTQYGETRQEGI